MLVFSDLDGTLLDHDSYQYDAATTALAALRARNIPLILATSKTLAEVSLLHQQLELDAPCIVENGAGVALPAGFYRHLPDDLQRIDKWLLKRFGRLRDEFLPSLHSIRRHGGYDFTGFDDMSIEEISSRTGLGLDAARRAANRQFTEPIVWQDSESHWRDFEKELQRVGLGAVRGGRFIHISGGGSKGNALNWIRQLFVTGCNKPLRTMALGDSDNDIDMLCAADIPVVIRSPAHGIPTIECRADIIVSEANGPQGWNSAILEQLAALEERIDE
jgi:mannosyl-3-phosphoglycerate phosphatase